MEETDNETFWNWINSLNPITIDFDENDEIVDASQLTQLTDRIESGIKEIKGQDNGHYRERRYQARLSVGGGVEKSCIFRGESYKVLHLFR